MHQISDFRSDTVTRPTEEMYQAMRTAPLGDDVLGDEPTVQKLEQIGAEVLGKPAALFCASGVMANQIAFHVHTRPGDEIILHEGAHTFNNETGAIAALSMAQARPIPGVGGMPTLETVLNAIRGPNTHHPRTRVVTLENTHNGNGGRVLPQDLVVQMGAAVKDRGLIFHLDGARIANAAVKLGCTIAELTEPFDSTTICLSKGLGSPVGSLVAGSEEFIAEARRVRKMFGGGMRQAGILAACGIISLTKMVERMADDHRNCRKLAEGLASIPGIEIDLSAVETNIVYFKVPQHTAKFPQIKSMLADRGVLALYLNPTTWRMCTHYDVDSEDVDRAISAWSAILAELNSVE
jgi:threonine aldolase